MANNTKIKNTILLNRSILTWGWYKDTNTSRLFIHLLLRVNYEDKILSGVMVKRGQIMTSLDSLRYETGMTVSALRTCISKLIKTNEIASTSTSKHRIITVLKYDTYQLNSKPLSKQNSKPVASILAPNNKDNTFNQYNPLNIKHYEDSKLNKLFIDFLRQRKSPKVKNTERAVNGLLKILKPFSDNIKTEMIEKSIISGWASVFELKNNFNSKGKNVLPKDIESDWLDDYIKQTRK